MPSWEDGSSEPVIHVFTEIKVTEPALLDLGRRTRSQNWLVLPRLPRERIGKVAGEIAAADLRSAAVNDGRSNPKRRQQPSQLGTSEKVGVLSVVKLSSLQQKFN